MKLRINRFEEVDGIEIPVNVTTSFDATGVTQLKSQLSQLESAFKKTSSKPTYSATMKDYFDSSSIEKYKSTMDGLKKQMSEIKPTIFSKDLFSRNEPSMLNMKTDYKSLVDEFKESIPVLEEVSNKMRNAFNVDMSDLKTQLKESGAYMKYMGKSSAPEQPVLLKDVFAQNTPSILEMDNAYSTVLDKFRDSTPILETLSEKMGKTKVNMEELKEQTKESVAYLQYMDDGFEENSKSADKAGNALQNFAHVIRSSVLIQVQALARTLRRAFAWFEKSFKSAGDFVESVNLYTMSVGEYAEAGREWATTISDALYLDPSEIYQFTGQFFNLTRGLGASAKAADLMSRNLTQLTYDMSSYLNIDVETANNKLMSAMSGQTKAVTSVGIAVQSASLQELAYSLGIKKSVQEMTQAEKTYLRYIQIMRSTQQMQGDLGRTIITPTNAMRLLRTQMNLFARSVGQVLTPVIMKAIPYVIAFTQLLTELAQTLASSFGYKLEDYLAPAGSVKAIANSFGDLDEEAKKAGKSVNRTLAPFDELNVVESKSNKTGANDTSVLADLEKYLDGYDMLEFYTDSMKNQVEAIKQGFKDMLPIVEAIAGIILTYKVVKTLGNVAQWLSGTASAVKNLASLFGFKGKGSATKILNETLKGTHGTADVCKTTESKFKLPKWSTIIKGLGQLALIVTAVIAYLGVLGLVMKIPGVEDTIRDGTNILVDTFIGIGTILVPLTAVSAGVIVLSKINVKQMATGLANMGIIMLGTETVVSAAGVIGAIAKEFIASGIETTKKVFEGIVVIAPEILGVSVALGAAGLFGTEGIKMVLAGLGDFALIILGTEVIMTAAGAISTVAGGFITSGIDMMKKVFEGIGSVALELVGVTAALAGAGLLMVGSGGTGYLAILAGLGAMAEVIAGVAVVLAAMGALKQIPGFDWLIGEGGKLLVKIGDIMGGFVGSIISGLVGKATDCLPKIGTDLTNFMNNAEPFFEKSAKIKEGAMKGIDYLCSAILKLTKKDILEGLTGWFAGKQHLVKFGKEITDFAPYFKKYSDKMADVNVSVVEKTSSAVDSVMKWANAVPKHGGVKQWWSGDNKLEPFGKELHAFGSYFWSYSDSMKHVSADIVLKTSEAAESIMKWANSVPKRDGVKQFFTGNNKLGSFGKELDDFGDYFWGYSYSMKHVDADIVSKSSDAASSIMAFANKVPSSGGFFSLFTGDNNLAKFGKTLAEFGKYFDQYDTNIFYIHPNKIETANDAISDLVNNLIKIKNNGLPSVLTSFGKALTDSGKAISTFFKADFNTSDVLSFGTNLGKQFGKNVKNAFKTEFGSISFDLKIGPMNLGKATIKPYARGGFPDTGELFIANEDGPEMIGKIGNKTAVANNDQIASALTNAMIVALKGNHNKQPIQNTIYIGNKKVFDGMNDYVDSENDRYGTNYVRV